MKAILLSVTAIWLAISPLPAQSNPAFPPLVPFGVIKGSVHDIETNQFVPWCSVEVVGEVPPTILPDGTFEFYMVPPGVYTVKATMTGYLGVSIDSVVVRMGQVTGLKIRLGRNLWFDSAGGWHHGALEEPRQTFSSPVADPSTQSATKIDIEIVATRVTRGTTDLFMMLTNPNDFDVYVGQCGSSRTIVTYSDRTGSISHGCGSICEYPDDFRLLRAHTRELSQFWRGAELKPGPNRFEVELGAATRDILPWNYVLVNAPAIIFTIVNADTSSR